MNLQNSSTRFSVTAELDLLNARVCTDELYQTRI